MTKATPKRTGFIYKSIVLSFILTPMSCDDDEGRSPADGQVFIVDFLLDCA